MKRRLGPPPGISNPVPWSFAVGTKPFILFGRSSLTECGVWATIAETCDRPSTPFPTLPLNSISYRHGWCRSISESAQYLWRYQPYQPIPEQPALVLPSAPNHSLLLDERCVLLACAFSATTAIRGLPSRPHDVAYWRDSSFQPRRQPCGSRAPRKRASYYHSESDA